MIKAMGGEGGMRAQMAGWQAGPLGDGQAELDHWVSQQGGGGAPTSTTTGGTPAGSNYASAIQALANPGLPTRFGATVPEASLAAQPSVLDNFLATHSGGTGAGGYSNKGFFDTLNSLRSGGKAA